MPRRSPRSRPKPRRGFLQRSILAVNSLLAVGCFAGAAGLVVGQNVVTSQAKIAPLTNLAKAELPEGLTTDDTFPDADPQAKNFLVTGADNNACIDPASPFAAAFGDRAEAGDRSDTIMIIRVDPASSRSAILSLPHDLWVPIAGTQTESRINSAYTKDNPQQLIETIFENFGIGIDHFVQIDFCAFKTLVDAVGGVSVPFELAARDTHTGLNVTQPGCFNFTGDHALAYVRSRHYETYDQASDEWTEDPFSDLGRISRQQDFIRRVMSKALSTGAFSPSFARGIINTAQDYVVVDQELTLGRLLEFAGVVQNLDPAQLQSYQIEVERKTIDDNDVLVPRLSGRNMQAVMAIFRGEAPLALPPELTSDGTTPLATDPPTTTIAPTTTTATTIAATGGVAGTTPTATEVPEETVVAATTAATSTSAAPTTTAASASENTKGVVPPAGVVCD